jgi:hypothetical protein
MIPEISQFLLCSLAAAAPCRIITTASLAHWGAVEYPRAAVQSAGASSRWFSYSESKLMNARLPPSFVKFVMS